MGLAENEQATQATIGFGNALNAKEPPDILKGRSIALAPACPAEMAASGSPVWTRVEWMCA